MCVCVEDEERWREREGEGERERQREMWTQVGDVSSKDMSLQTPLASRAADVGSFGGPTGGVGPPIPRTQDLAIATPRASDPRPIREDQVSLGAGPYLKRSPRFVRAGCRARDTADDGSAP